MKHNSTTLFLGGGALAVLLASLAFGQGPGEVPPPAPRPPVGFYTNTSGVIAQLNYNPDAMPDGFLLNDKTLVHLPPNVAPIIGPTVKAGDSVVLIGFANTTPSGLRTIDAQEVKDRTSGKIFTLVQPGPAAPYSGSGKIQQLNYAPDGAVNGFLLDNGAFATLRPFSATNPSSIRPGAPVSFTGYARTSITGRTIVDLQTVTLNGQTLTLSAADPEAGANPPPPPPAPRRDASTEQPPPPPPPPDVPDKP